MVWGMDGKRIFRKVFITGLVLAELTVAPESGRKGFHPKEDDSMFGKLW